MATKKAAKKKTSPAAQTSKAVAKAIEPKRKQTAGPRELTDETFEQAYDLFREQQTEGNFPEFSELGLNDRLLLRGAAEAALGTDPAVASDFQKCVQAVLTS